MSGEHTPHYSREEINETKHIPMQNSGPQPQEKVRIQEPGSLRGARMYFQSSRELA